MKVAKTLLMACTLAVFWSLPFPAVAGDPSSLSYELKTYPSPGESPGVPTLNPAPKDAEPAPAESPAGAPQEQEAEPPPPAPAQDETPADIAPVYQQPLEQPPVDEAPPEPPPVEQGTP